MALITVAIPVFNREVLVAKALESALRQPESDLEILVIDNASTDRTWEVLNGYRDPRLRLVRNPSNVGLFGNFNRCLELASGEYVCTLCSDDVLADGFLGDARDLMERHPGMAMVSSRGRAHDLDTGRIRPLGGNLPAGIYAREDAVIAALWALCTYYVNPFNYPSGMLLRTARARDAGRMDESMGFAADVKMYLKMLESSDFAILDRVGCEVLLHSDQEGAKIHRDIRFIHEFADHFTTHEALIARRGWSAYVGAHLAGFLIGSAWKLRSQGRADLAKQCGALMRDRRLSQIAGLLGGMHSALERGRLDRTGRTRSPVEVRPIEGDARDGTPR